MKLEKNLRKMCIDLFNKQYGIIRKQQLTKSLFRSNFNKLLIQKKEKADERKIES